MRSYGGAPCLAPCQAGALSSWHHPAFAVLPQRTGSWQVFVECRGIEWLQAYSLTVSPAHAESDLELQGSVGPSRTHKELSGTLLPCPQPASSSLDPTSFSLWKKYETKKRKQTHKVHRVFSEQWAVRSFIYDYLNHGHLFQCKCFKGTYKGLLGFGWAELCMFFQRYAAQGNVSHTQKAHLSLV